jgi:uncharacterized membrane protein YgcG
MGLINLRTNLKDLKFGQDRIHGGSSNQPYIQTSIPGTTEGAGSPLNYDFVLRGGLNTVRDSVTDIRRLGKWFFDLKTPSGLLFIAKQNLLSRTAVPTQASVGVSYGTSPTADWKKAGLNEGIYTPISTLIQAGGNAFGVHVNKQGLNPFDGIGTLTKYLDVVNPILGNELSIKNNLDKNRLVELYNSHQNPNSPNYSANAINVLSYSGGPGSILGIGQTNIKFADQRTNETAQGNYGVNYLVGNKDGNGSIGSETDRSDITLNYRNALGLSRLNVTSTGKIVPEVLGSPFLIDSISGFISLSNVKFTGLVDAPTGVGTSVSQNDTLVNNIYYIGQNSNRLINNVNPNWKTYLIGNPNGNGAKQSSTKLSDLNYRNALGLSKIDFFATKKGSNFIKGRSLSTPIYSGLNISGSGNGSSVTQNFNGIYYVGADSNQIIDNVVPNPKTYLATGGTQQVNLDYKNALGLSNLNLTGLGSSYITTPLNQSQTTGLIITGSGNGINVAQNYPGVYYVGQNSNRLINNIISGSTLLTYQNNPLTGPTPSGTGFGISGGVVSSTDTSLSYDQTQISDVQSTLIADRTVQDFRAVLRNSLLATSTAVSDGLTPFAPDYTTQNIEQRVKLGYPGAKGRNLSRYSQGWNGSGASSPTSYDAINASEVEFASNAGINSHPDLINFKIEILNNDSPQQRWQLYFRAFLDNISDSYNAQWDTTRYIGRGEDFYNYTGFTRKVSLSWTVAAQSKAELMPMYRRLNWLASTVTPDYSPAGGYMRGNIATLTVGDYFKGQYGIITGFTFEMNGENDTWEIAIDENGNTDASVAQLPHIVKVKSFEFIPIHNFVPRRYNGVENYINAIEPYPIPGGTVNPSPSPNPSPVPTPTPTPAPAPTPAPPVIGGGGGSGAGTNLLILQSSANNSPTTTNFTGFGGGSSGGGGAGGGW